MTTKEEVLENVRITATDDKLYQFVIDISQA